MKKGIWIFVTAILMMSLTACGGSVSEKIHKRYGSLESYTALVRVTVFGQKDNAVYELSQSWRSPDSYRNEAVQPENIKGTVTVIHDGMLWIRGADAPAIQMDAGIGTKQKDFLFMGEFLEEYYQGEPPELEENEAGWVMLADTKNKGGEERFVRNLWIDAKSLQPKQLSTYNKEGNEVLRVEYLDFVPNAEIADSAFLP